MTDEIAYTPPKVWTWNKENGGQFANINRPIAGPTHEKDLPVGRHPLQLYSLATPNGVKVTVMLEELLARGHAGAEYDAWLINIREGDQFGSGFVGVNPNSKIPALVDRSGPTPIRVFESGAILIHLAEKFGAFLPTEPAARAQCLSWLMWQMGSAPYLGGGELILRLRLKVAGVVALVQLARRLAGEAVDHASAPDRRPLGDGIGPALDILVLRHLQELAGLVDQALGERAVPGPDRHISDGVLRPAQVFAFGQAPV